GRRRTDGPIALATARPDCSIPEPMPGVHPAAATGLLGGRLPGCVPLATSRRCRQGSHLHAAVAGPLVVWRADAPGDPRGRPDPALAVPSDGLLAACAR